MRGRGGREDRGRGRGRDRGRRGGDRGRGRGRGRGNAGGGGGDGHRGNQSQPHEGYAATPMEEYNPHQPQHAGRYYDNASYGSAAYAPQQGGDASGWYQYPNQQQQQPFYDYPPQQFVQPHINPRFASQFGIDLAHVQYANQQQQPQYGYGGQYEYGYGGNGANGIKQEEWSGGNEGWSGHGGGGGV